MVSLNKDKFFLIFIVFVLPLMAGSFFPALGNTVSIISGLVTPPVTSPVTPPVLTPTPNPTVPVTPPVLTPTPTVTLPPLAISLALQKSGTSSSIEDSTLTPDKAFDSTSNTRWASAEGIDPQWISVDLGALHSISRIYLQWETAYAKEYQIQISNDGTTWIPIYSTTNGNGGIDDFNVSGVGRYVRMYGTKRATPWGYSLWNFEVYGVQQQTSDTLTLTSPNGGEVLHVGETYRITWNAPSTINHVYISYRQGNNPTDYWIVGSGPGVANTGYYDWNVGINAVPNSEVVIVLYGYQSHGGIGGQADQSDNFFSVVQSVGNPTVTPTQIITPTSTPTPTIPSTPTPSIAPTILPTPTQITVSNVALNKVVYSSGNENNSLGPDKVVDGKLNTRWGSTEGIDPQWVTVDLGTVFNIRRVKLTWEAAFAKTYFVQTSNDNQNWTNAATYLSSGDGGVDDMNMSVSGRYVRVYGTQRATPWGYSLWEFEVYGVEENSLPSLQITSPNGGETFIAGQNKTITWNSSHQLSSVWIRYIFQDGTGDWIVMGVPNTGFHNWMVNVGNKTGNIPIKLELRGYIPNYDWVQDESDGFLTVNHPLVTITPTLTPTPLITPTPIPNPNNVNRALNRPVQSSGNEHASLSQGNAVDGIVSTRWASLEGVDPQWISVDLGAVYEISRVKLRWEVAYARAYEVQVSQDGIHWSFIYGTPSGDGGLDDIGVGATGRYVRIYGTQRATPWGYSLWELEVY